MNRQATTLIAALTLVGCTTALRADPVADFYHTHPVRLIIGSNNGGSYDSYGRMFAAHFSRHVPGEPAIQIENMPGASGIRSTNYLYSIAPKDGSTIAIVNQSMAQRQMLEPASVEFDMNQFNWLGAMTNTGTIFITWGASGVTSIDDAKARQVTMGALSNDGGNAVYPLLLNRFLGTKFKIVLGYQGGNTIQLAMERGEVDGRGSVAWSGLKAGWPNWIAERKVNVILQVGLVKEPELPDVPLLVDLARDDKERSIFRFISSDSAMGFPIATPPRAPADSVAALRKAVAETLADPEFLADAQKRGLPISAASGEEVAAIVNSQISTPKDVIAVLKQSLSEAEKGR